MANFCFPRTDPSNDVSVVDLKTNKEVSRIKAGSSPWGIASHFPMMNSLLSGDAACKPCLNARVRRTAGPLNLIGFSYSLSVVPGTVPSKV